MLLIYDLPMSASVAVCLWASRMCGYLDTSYIAVMVSQTGRSLLFLFSSHNVDIRK